MDFRVDQKVGLHFMYCLPIDKNRINIIDPLVGSISAFIIIKADNAKVPTENNINPIIPLNTFIIQD